MNEYGLAKSHAYTVLGAYEVTTSAGAKVKLVHMRNPWHMERYKGPYNDNDAIWTNDAGLKSQVPYAKDNNDGKFFIPVSDFFKAFRATQILSLQPESWIVNYHEVLADDGTSKRFTFTVTTAVPHMYISLDVYDPRMLPSTCDVMYQTTGKVFLYKKDGTRVNYAYASLYLGYASFEVTNLAAGEYYIDASVAW